MLSCFTLLALLAAGDLPSFYKEVDRLIWMVKDVDKTVGAWSKAGVVNVAESGEYEDDDGARYKWVRGSFAGVPVMWAQALGGSNVFTEFAKKREGVAAVLHRVGSDADFRAEVERMKGLGVPMLKRGQLSENAYYGVFDTAVRGKYLLGIVYDPETHPGTRKVSQYAFMLRDAPEVAKFWASLGWPEMTYTDPVITDHQYKGKPSNAAATLGWHRHGKVVYEWIIPKRGPSAWQDQLDRSGEGFHHFGMNVEDMDAAIAQWQKAGFELTQAGGWGEKGKKGSGRFAYLSHPAGGGVDIELLWNYREP